MDSLNTTTIIPDDLFQFQEFLMFRNSVARIEPTPYSYFQVQVDNFQSLNLQRNDIPLIHINYSRLKQQHYINNTATSLLKDLETDCCSICLGNLKAKDVIIELYCSHTFHQICIAEWLKISDKCPMCRNTALNK